MEHEAVADGIVELGEAECWRLLAAHNVGRLAVIAGQRPLVFPVNYALDGDLVLIRTAEGTKLANASLDRVAFEVDELDLVRRTGWSVLVQGLGIDITDAIDAASERERAMVVETWAPGDKPHLVRITHPEISGRRIVRTGTAPQTLSELLEPPARISAAATLREAAAALADAGGSCLVVGTHSPPWIITEHDVAGALSAGMAPQDEISTLATKAPVWATTSTTLPEAAELMVRHGVRHLVVVDSEGGLSGVLPLSRAVAALLV